MKVTYMKVTYMKVTYMKVAYMWICGDKAYGYIQCQYMIQRGCQETRTEASIHHGSRPSTYQNTITHHSGGGRGELEVEHEQQPQTKFNDHVECDITQLLSSVWQCLLCYGDHMQGDCKRDTAKRVETMSKWNTYVYQLNGTYPMVLRMCIHSYKRRGVHVPIHTQAYTS